MSYRKLKAINIDHLKEDTLEIQNYGDFNVPDEFVQLYNNSLTSIIDKHAPLKKKLVSKKPKVT